MRGAATAEYAGAGRGLTILDWSPQLRSPLILLPAATCCPPLHPLVRPRPPRSPSTTRFTPRPLSRLARRVSSQQRSNSLLFFFSRLPSTTPDYLLLHACTPQLSATGPDMVRPDRVSRHACPTEASG